MCISCPIVFFTFMFYPFFFSVLLHRTFTPNALYLKWWFLRERLKKSNQDGIKQLNKRPTVRDRLQIWNSSNGLRVLNLKKNVWLGFYCIVRLYINISPRITPLYSKEFHSFFTSDNCNYLTKLSLLFSFCFQPHFGAFSHSFTFRAFWWVQLQFMKLISNSTEDLWLLGQF